MTKCKNPPIRGPDSHIIQELGQSIGYFVGLRIQQERMKKGLTLRELCLKAGLAAGRSPKVRMWEIESSSQNKGIRLGTLYVIALALEIEPTDLLPTKQEIEDIFGDGLMEIIKKSQERVKRYDNHDNTEAAGVM